MTERMDYRSSLNARLGFEVPPFRPPYAEWKTDYGIGIAGLHWVVLIMHLPAYQAARFRVVAASEIDPDRIADTRKKHYEVGPIDDDFREMVRRPDVEVVDSSFGHAPGKQERRLALVEACAAAGKHVMIHKPAAYTLAVAEQMARVAREGGIHLAVNQDCRYNPATYTIKQLLQPGRMGRPYLIELRNYWRGEMSRFHPGRFPATMQHLVHHADLLRWWIGRPCTSVYAQIINGSTVATYTFDDGTVATHTECHDGHTAHETDIRIVAEGGVIEAAHNWNWHYPGPGRREFVEVYPDTREPPVPLPLPDHVYEPPWSGINPWIPIEGPYYDLAGPVAGMMGSMAHLMRGVETGRAPDNDIDGAIESLRICFASEISAQTGQAVNPADVPSDTTTVTARRWVGGRSKKG